MRKEVILLSRFNQLFLAKLYLPSRLTRTRNTLATSALLMALLAVQIAGTVYPCVNETTKLSSTNCARQFFKKKPANIIDVIKS